MEPAVPAVPQVALLTFTEGREEFYQRRKGLVAEEQARVERCCGGWLELQTGPPIRRKAELKAALAAAGPVDALILHIPIFVEPALVVAAATLTQGTVPLLLLGNRRPDTSSLIGLLGAGGALDQMGVAHRRLWEDIERPETQRALFTFCRAAQVRRRLRGQTFGCFGGYSLGIQTAAADPLQWQTLFGVEVRPLDQYLIVMAAERAPAEDVDRHARWLTERSGGVYQDGDSFTDSHLQRQVRSYLGTRQLVRDLGLDFISVKCQTELSDHYVLQCVSHSLLNDPYDADGPKEPIASSCEADMDGALTMQILKLLSGGSPVATQDVRLFEAERSRFILANCGASPSFFAALSTDPETNLKAVHLRPHVFGKAGGAATQFVFAPTEMTLARLCRRRGQYWLAVILGQTEAEDREALRRTTWPWPQAFVAADIDFPAFLAEYGSNHICAVPGNLVAELQAFGGMLGIPVRVFNRTA